MNAYGSHFRRVTLGLCLVLALLVSSSAVMAGAPPEQKPGPADAARPDAPTGVTTADDGELDVGAEHVADAPPSGAGGSDLPICATSASNFYNRLRAAGFTGSDSFFWANGNVWQSDWKRAALGGSENSWVDNVDIAYYCDHGSNGAVYFPWGHTSNWLVPNDCYQSWGDKDNEWMAFGTCLTLTNRQGWANCMNGQHLILGYTTVSYDADEGGAWADYMLGWQWLGIWFRQPQTVAQAWFSMCDAVQPSSVQARVIGEDWTHWYDKLHGRGGPYGSDAVDAYYYWWDHNCYKAPPAQIDAASLATLVSVPSATVQGRTVTEAYAQGIAVALQMTGTVQLSDDGAAFSLTDTSFGMTRTLTVNTATGGYTYQDLGQLWLPPAPGTPTFLPSEQEAIALANEGLRVLAQALPGLSNADPAAPHAETEKITQVARGGVFGIQSSVVLTGTNTDVMVAYARKPLSLGVTGANGAILAASVAGPGATTKAYFGGQAGNSPLRLGMAPSPIGLAGGSRDVAAGSNVTLMDTGKAWDAFNADKQLAIVTVPLDADEIISKSVTFAYYEQPLNVPQQELIPAWVYTADFKKDGQLLAADVLVYVPASADYYPPEVSITSPVSGTLVWPGQPVAFTAAATGDFGPFAYEWDSSEGGKLGAGQTLTAALSRGQHPGAEAAPQTISVKVTNKNGQSRTASISVRVGTLIYLPMGLKTE